ncbi:MAG TPA: UDP-N-acetylmuramoyl-tripeptide--D-alanyl-D-alanine ligase [Egibacteraceae bacterium]|nr:UDP-N-acetylmuramoyl-tripeptide--D-alanyl-D-alanine ligase [Egibacteraceae bacterium]
MIPLTLAMLADVVAGELVAPSDMDRVVDSVVIDSRQARPGALFVPLAGERADGHDFIADAAARGAAGYLLAAGHQIPDGPGAVVVDDSGDALLGLGAWVRAEVDPTVVAVTGSAGKTTTKDLIASAVGAGRRVVASPGSYNNDLGVPLTCCLLESDSEVLVAEVGTRGIGHIAKLARVLAPDIAVVTSVSASHLSLLGSIETVARAKTELVAALGPDGVAVLNADDPRVAAMRAAAPGRVVTYGQGPESQWRPDEVSFDELARATLRVRGVALRLPLPGGHNVGNALAALAVADLCGVELERAAEGLARATVSPWRMQVLRAASGLTVVNDAYNANPASMEAALKTLALMRVRGRRWAVLGQMAELGAAGEEAHDRIGRLCIRLGLDGVVVVGAEADGIRRAADQEGFYGQGDLIAVEGPAEALKVLAERVGPDDVVLVKASRSVGLEQLAEALAAGNLA